MAQDMIQIANAGDAWVIRGDVDALGRLYDLISAALHQKAARAGTFGVGLARAKVSVEPVPACCECHRELPSFDQDRTPCNLRNVCPEHRAAHVRACEQCQWLLRVLFVSLRETKPVSYGGTSCWEVSQVHWGFLKMYLPDVMGWLSEDKQHCFVPAAVQSRLLALVVKDFEKGWAHA